MTISTTLTWTSIWKSITVLPPLIGVSVFAAVVVAVMQDLSLHFGVGLLVGALAVAEIGYLCILILVDRRDAARSIFIDR